MPVQNLFNCFPATLLLKPWMTATVAWLNQPTLSTFPQCLCDVKLLQHIIFIVFACCLKIIYSTTIVWPTSVEVTLSSLVNHSQPRFTEQNRKFLLSHVFETLGKHPQREGTKLSQQSIWKAREDWRYVKYDCSAVVDFWKTPSVKTMSFCQEL